MYKVHIMLHTPLQLVLNDMGTVHCSRWLQLAPISANAHGVRYVLHAQVKM